MGDRLSTRKRILDASRQLFNEKGYAATTLAEIASFVGIAQGNLTYHFPNKRDLVRSLEEETRNSMEARWADTREGSVADDYVEHLIFAMQLTWHSRFLLRDRAQFADDPKELRDSPYMVADFRELQGLIERIAQEKLFRSDIQIDLDVLARSLWITSRYWMDHLQELEGVDHITWAHLELGVKHHFALLLPAMKQSARRDFELALDTAMRFLRTYDVKSSPLDIAAGERAPGS